MYSSEQISSFYNDYVQKLSECNVRHFRIFESLDKLLHDSQPVLDMGCGTGLTSRYQVTQG